MPDFVRFRIDSSVQPIAIPTELQHRPLKRAYPEFPSAVDHSASPAMDCLTTAFDTKLSNCRVVFEGERLAD
ncbi:hypothetical protein C488_14872 [Natrinema pellirubrum DSM 15624]|uniref:Uncharacterized protein n=1 Tax=Natrinema pellirubrum (strain DSM 15624 / CIP 106293 / JCM 10476 / NCIMB 786 / 157) TaxID=797303 RepID=L9YGE7_NATP1|nr:hypothetical protein C488_14872 [Natrinema pellirubrum DSM 15624]